MTTEFSDLIRATFPQACASEFGRSLIAHGGPFEVVEDEVDGERFAVFARRPASILTLLTEAADQHADRDYLIDDDRRLTYAQTMAAVLALADELRHEHGVGPGDRVGIDSANSLEWVLSFWATLAVDAIPALMNSFWSDPELRVGLELVTPSVVLADAPRADQIARVAPATAVVRLDDELYRRTTGAAAPTGQRPPQPESREDDVALIMFTSGTTGKPKAVAHTHRSVVGTIQCNKFNTVLRTGALPTVPPTAPPPPPKALLAPPLFHLSALYGAVLMFLGAGGAVVLRPGRFDEVRTMAAIQDEEVSVWLSVGSAAPRVAAHPERDRYDLSSLKSVVVGGAPLSPALKHSLCAAFPTAAAAGGLRMGYTSSEGGSIVASIGGPAFAEHPESTGPIQDGVQVSIRDGSGAEVAPGQEGAIHVRSAYTMHGYWGDVAETAATYRPGRWLAMGDVGSIRDGLLYVNSRARDLIFVSAENVYPSEVENRLESHPEVIESCVAGIDDPVTGQAIKAFVVLPAGSATTSGELADWCRAGLPRFKVPTAWELRTERLPRNPAGKIVRTTLLAELDLVP